MNPINFLRRTQKFNSGQKIKCHLKRLLTYFACYIECLNVHETHVIASNTTNKNVFFFLSNLKIVYNNNY